MEQPIEPIERCGVPWCANSSCSVRVAGLPPICEAHLDKWDTFMVFNWFNVQLQEQAKSKLAVAHLTAKEVPMPPNLQRRG